MVAFGAQHLSATFREPVQIKHIIMMGDSLSDRGTLNKTFLFGCIPMRYLSGLNKHSPDGRFTNGLVWSDHVTASIASDFTIKRLQKKWQLDDKDIADAVIARDKRILRAVYDSYSLDDDRFVNYRGKVWVRSYCEGGLMSHDYSWTLSSSIPRFFSRIILSALTDMRKKILQYDDKHHISHQQKAETLVIEWSGANDLVTVNAKPSFEEVDKAMAARIQNAKKLMAAGYRHFILFNLPDLSLTPRFQAKSEKEREEARQCSLYFNTQLQNACEQLNRDYPHCIVNVFDVNTEFLNIYQNPARYYFDPEKRAIAYTDSEDFDDPSDGSSPARGYLFYDDLHPSADMHALLASHFYSRLSTQYELLEPDRVLKSKRACSEEALLASFRKQYKTSLDKDKQGFFYAFQHPRIDYKQASLEEILRHALQEGGTRTRHVLKELGWLSKKGELMLDVPVLQQAMANISGSAPLTIIKSG
ncbi:SGNH/GDSL hydrolase family protein [Legionella oakridgensis]|uniref:Putative thermolabile hemolysin n=1 Tax=Legionella oakridgensis TaxID=29423 RepID=A0A0W0WY82_9GAMM|nr:SGNH/GDSL hydrolase family protein [Legionella oakridgensis]KTD37188.1 putative thermolabile hemolysin [Legionella oakridgensis]STY20132.1 thermolabile hemolysin [Legionella longbeachae]